MTNQLNTLEQELAALPSPIKDTLSTYSFDRDRFLRQAQDFSKRSENLVKGKIAPPKPGDIVRLPEAPAERQRLAELGTRALSRGECALVVLAGGMATRMGGVVKALVPALGDKTFLDLRLAEQKALAHAYGAEPPLWLMTSQATDAAIRNTLGDRLDGYQRATFHQDISLRLTPEGRLFFDRDGQPSLYAPGHGDLPDALRRSGLLQRFCENGGRLVLMTNLDNLGGGLDPTIIGWHLEHGAPLTSEVVDKVGSDRGGIPVRLDDAPVVLEEFRIPKTFDPSSVSVFNINTFLVDAQALAQLELDWTYFTVEKNVDGRKVIQFERLINEITFVLKTRYLHVPRSGESSRFVPVKSQEELEQRRQEISALARARGMLE